MRLFNKKEKEVKEVKECSCGGLESTKETGGCGCGCDCESETELNTEKVVGINSIKILGGGCAKCNQLEATVKEAMKELGIDCVVDHVKDYGEIAAMGVMSLPALAINDKVVSYGKVLKKAEAITILEEYK